MDDFWGSLGRLIVSIASWLHLVLFWITDPFYSPERRKARRERHRAPKPKGAAAHRRRSRRTRRH